MFSMLLSALWCGILFIILPYFIGFGFINLFRNSEYEKICLTRDFVTGFIVVWSLVEIFAVPLTIYKVSFNVLLILVSVVALGFAIFGLVKFILLIRKKKGILRNTLFKVLKDKTDVIMFILFFAFLIYVIYRIETTYFYDADDSRFIVNSAETIKHRKILSTDPTTGLAIKTNYGDFKKDLVSQWSSFLAFSSIVSGVHVTIFAHTVFPIIAMLMLFSALWHMMNVICADRNKISTSDKCMAMIVVMGMYIYGNYSLRNAETFIMIRSWQGKAVLAGIGILAIIWAFMVVYNHPTKVYGYILLLMVNISTCLMSSMGIIISSVMIAVYSLFATAFTKKIRVLLLSILICIPNVVLYLISEGYTIDKFLS